MKRVKEIIRCPEEGYAGENIVVAVMDTGIALHPEICDRLLLFRDFVGELSDPYDDNGHGTHVAGIIAGRHIGIAPKCSLIILKVLDRKGNGKLENCMSAFRWLLENQEKYNIRVVNISMGMGRNATELNGRRILKAVELLWDRGFVVTAAAGNRGPGEGTVTIPGRSKQVITVGAYDVNYSGRGSKEEDLWKPDLVAPGKRIFSCNANWQKEGAPFLIGKSGTSMATPVVSGAVAVLLSQASYLTNIQVKNELKACCINLQMDVTRQGRGLLNMEKLLRGRL